MHSHYHYMKYGLLGLVFSFWFLSQVAHYNHPSFLKHAFIFLGVVDCLSFTSLFEKLQIAQYGLDRILNIRDIVTDESVKVTDLKETSLPS